MTITIVGDLSLQDIDAGIFKIGPKLADLLNRSDLNIANLESVMTKATTPIPNHPIHLKASHESKTLLKYFHAVTLANNHVHDYGEEGVLDTINELNRQKIEYFGIAENDHKASAPYVLDQGAEKLAVISASRYCRHSSEMVGTAGDNHNKIFKQIKKYSRAGYFVVVYYHWGYEYISLPSPRDRLLARKCIRHGAGLIVGSHPHVRQKYELYQGKPIVYSLGNFIFSNQVTKAVSHLSDLYETKKGFLLQLKTEGKKLISAALITCEIGDTDVELSNSEKPIDLLNSQTTGYLLDGKTLAYLKEYAEATSTIKAQNEFIRGKYLSYAEKNLWGKLKTYKNINWQDIFNRIVGTILQRF